MIRYMILGISSLVYLVRSGVLRNRAVMDFLATSGSMVL